MDIYFIAEIGINHNGDLKIAKKLIDVSVEAGFNAVKFQKRTLEQVYSKEFLDSPRESQWGSTQRDQKNGLEFDIKEYNEIDKYCKSKNIDWFASAWDLESLKFLDNYKLKFNKIASAMIVDTDFLKEVAKRKTYTFISTGMSTEKNIEDAVKIFRSNNCSFELMHCVSDYPLDFKEANLLTINALKNKFNCKVGYSGHEPGLAVSFAASNLGISSLERHVTLDRSMYGSDQASSLEPSGMKHLISTINKMSASLGEEKLGNITETEKVISKKLREHIKKS
jgi:N-acetylneuraminate synthase